MIFLVLAVACSTGIAVIFRITEGRFERMALLTANYGIAIGLAALRLTLEGSDFTLAADARMLVLGAMLGALFISGFALFSKAIGLAGLSLATAVMRLSVAMPFVASWLVWGEAPSAFQLTGLGVAAGALVLITRPRAPATGAALAADTSVPFLRGGAVLSAAVLALLFVNGGLVDTALKVFEEEFADVGSRPQFLLFAFTVAFVLGGILIVVRGWGRGSWPGRGVLPWGVALGLINYASVEFILLALRELPGTVVFPANNVAIVACATLLGVVVWREQLSSQNRLGMVLAALSLVLLAF